MNLSDLKTSKFLRKEDIGDGVLVTIKSLTRENVAVEGAEPDLKVAVHFEELDKPLVLNSTNGQLLAKITGKSENLEIEWIGHRIVLFSDPNITFQGRLVGGIRVRAPKQGSSIQAKAEPHLMQTNNDLPF